MPSWPAGQRITIDVSGYVAAIEALLPADEQDEGGLCPAP